MSLLDAKEQVRQAVDIVDLVGSYIQLRRQGRNYVGLCPWHEDRRPSLQVNPDRQTFKCWVCDIGGDVFSFIMQIEGLPFPEALAMLAERAGIELKPERRGPDDSAGGSKSDGPIDKRVLLKALAWAEGRYHDCLMNAPDAEPARRYLAERGISAESIARFGLGFSPTARDWILDQADRNPKRAQVLEAVGILARSESGGWYDRFKARLLFSIRDAQGRPVGMGGRVLPELATHTTPAKYVNSPETALFSKSRLLYGLDLARQAIRREDRVLVMEGYTDVIAAHQAGFENAVAVLGTALGEAHIRLLKRFTDHVVLVLDGDEAGQRRTNEILELFASQPVDLKIVTLPQGLDPCEFLEAQGANAFRQAIEEQAVDALDHAFAIHTRDIDVDRDVHAATQALEHLIALVAKAPVASDGGLRLQRIVQRIAGRFRVDEQDIRRRMAERRRGVSRPVGAGVASAQPARRTPLDAWRRE
ncbi:MAG: DNA primase, partial [Planctomycetota bacterium]